MPDAHGARLPVESEEDMLVPKLAKTGKQPSGRKGDDRLAHVSPAEPRVQVSLDGRHAEKTILLGRKA